MKKKSLLTFNKKILLMSLAIFGIIFSGCGEINKAETSNPTISNDIPTVEPTEAPTVAPTEKPTEVPTEVPTVVPTEKPTEVPTEIPTSSPTETPTEKPTEVPTETPTEKPTEPEVNQFAPVFTEIKLHENISPKLAKSNEKRSIDDLVDFDVIQNDMTQSFVTKGVKFMLEVHLRNPKQYEIQSITINGKKYAGYQFDKNSTMECILVKMENPYDSGYVDFNVDAIKYIDGDIIKNALFEGKRTIKIGISYINKPSVETGNLYKTYKSFEFNFRLVDRDHLLKNNSYFYLSDGMKIVEKRSVSLGYNFISFDNLIYGGNYEFGIASSFDFLDGKDFHTEWLLIDNIKLDDPLSIKLDSINHDSIKYSINGIKDGINIKNIELYETDSNLLVDSKSNKADQFDNLKSNTKYSIKVIYFYNFNDNLIESFAVLDNITTDKYDEPIIEIVKLNVGNNFIEYELKIPEVKYLISVNKVSIKDENNEIVNSNDGLLKGKFLGLLSNKKYSLIINYSYDLNDNKGIIEKETVKECVTNQKAVGSMYFSLLEADTTTSISYKLAKNDPDNSVTFKKIEIKGSDDVILETKYEETGTFEHLTFNTQYTFVVTYEVNLNDGLGSFIRTLEQKCGTADRVFPTSVDLMINEAYGIIYYGLTFECPSDITVDVENVQLYENGILLQTVEAEVAGEFEIEYHKTYTIKANLIITGKNNDTYTYSKEWEISTHFYVNSEPCFTLGDLDVKDTYISGKAHAYVYIVGDSGCAFDYPCELYEFKIYDKKTNNLLFTNKEFYFDNLTPNTAYIIEVFYKVPNDDGSFKSESTKFEVCTFPLLDSFIKIEHKDSMKHNEYYSFITIYVKECNYLLKSVNVNGTNKYNYYFDTPESTEYLYKIHFDSVLREQNYEKNTNDFNISLNYLNETQDNNYNRISLSLNFKVEIPIL